MMLENHMKNRLKIGYFKNNALNYKYIDDEKLIEDKKGIV